MSHDPGFRQSGLTAFVRGGQVPSGHVRVSGAKNAATRLLAAALVSDERVILENFPTELVDVRYKMDFIQKCGGAVEVDKENNRIALSSINFKDTELDDYDLPVRTTYLLVPALIKRSGIARIPYPGGCKIGNRKYDLHLMIWEKLGATVRETDQYIEVSTKGGFRPGKIDFPISTIGGTENALISASIIEGETVIYNSYISPEVDCLIQFLRSMGVKIEITGSSMIRINGRSRLSGSVFSVIPDRIEALTWITYGILSGGDVTIDDVPFSSMKIPLVHLSEAGIDFYHNSRSVRVCPDCLMDGVISPFELATGTHPGVISDMQPFFVLLGLHSVGTSRIFDYRYPDRTRYCEELSKFYPGKLKWESGMITAYGQHEYQPVPADTTSTDLRGSMALIIAALLASGDSRISFVEMALRGYNDLLSKFSKLGIEVTIG